MQDEKYMKMALIEAQKAFAKGEVPIGAVLVVNDEIVAAGHNLRETNHDATAHAEMEVIREACQKLGRWRLSGATLYVTVEPCPMCAGGLLMSRVDRIVYGAPDSKAGAVDSLFNVVSHPQLNHRMLVTAGVLENACRQLMQDFFRKRRREIKAARSTEKNQLSN